MKHVTTALLSLVFLLAACAAPGRVPSEETFLDKDLSSLELVDVALAAPEFAGPSGGLLAPAMRVAGRRYLIDVKDFAVMADAATDTALAGGTIDGPAAAKAAGADALIAIRVTNWDTSELLPRGFAFASGTVTAWASRDGRRVFEHAFENVRMTTPGQVTGATYADTEIALVGDLARRVLASFPRKKPR